MDTTRPAILDRIDAFCERWPQAEFGPAHLVMSDYNLSDYHIGYVAGCCDCYTGDHSADEIAATRAFLTDLLLDEDGRAAVVEELAAVGWIAVGDADGD